jgi:hypothetical protein
LTNARGECLMEKIRVTKFIEVICREKTVDTGKHTVVTFRSYPFTVGQKIYIQDGPRHGDWEVAAVTDRKVTLRCPISHREFTWDRFCYFMEECKDSPWPHPD